MRRQSYDGPLLTGRALVRGAAIFALAVALYGYATDHDVHNAQQLLTSVLTDLQHLGRQDTQGAGRQPPASANAKADIPVGYLAAYRSAARICPNLTWSLLAAIGKVESDHGRVRLPGVRSGANWAGAAGPMQLGIGGKAGDTWGRYGDGVPGHVYRIGSAAKAAAHKLCADGVRTGRISQAVYAYNHDWGYVARVRAIARRYQREP